MSASVEQARLATIADIGRLVELGSALRDELRVMRGGPLWEMREARLHATPDAFQTFLARGDAAIVVGTIDDVVVGYGTIEVEELGDGTRLGIVGDLYVEPEARAIGVGECIADLLVARAHEAGCRGVDAFALPGHRSAKNFFERSGFTARALVMYKRLAPDADDPET
ncbi:MAG: GNAT family N-acetyltransferase [Actinomycetota bacterium]